MPFEGGMNVIQKPVVAGSAVSSLGNYPGSEQRLEINPNDIMLPGDFANNRGHGRECAEGTDVLVQSPSQARFGGLGLV